MDKQIMETLELRVSALEERLEKLEVRAKKRARGEFNSSLQLAEQKQTFLDSRPHDRTDPFTDWELVFWAAYLLANTSRRDRIDTMAELVKRASKVKLLVAHFTEQYYSMGGFGREDERNKKLADDWARLRAKAFIEMMLLTYSKAGDKPMNFWMAVSGWAVTQYGSKLATWQQVHSIEDRPPLPEAD